MQSPARSHLQTLRSLVNSLSLLSLSIKLRVVLVVQAQDSPLKEGQVARVHCNAVVLSPPALLDVLPSPLLLQQIKPCSGNRLSLAKDIPNGGVDN